MLDNERLYVDLLFRASGKKYASWDPEVPVEVGDWGRITKGDPGWAFWRKRRGIFIKEGNIYKDGKAEEYDIPAPEEHGADALKGVTWITSDNTRECSIEVAAGSQTPAFVQCGVKEGFSFTSGYGALLAMDNDTITAVNPAGCLRRLLEDKKMHGLVVVSEAHRCHSYARFLTAKNGGKIAVGLDAQPPISNVASASVDASWIRSASTGNFKSKVNKSGNRDFYPLFRLVSLEEEATSTGLRAGIDQGDPELPVAIPPWQQ